MGVLLTFRVSMLQSYNTEIPMETYTISMTWGVAMTALFAFGMMSGAAAFLTSFFPDSLAALRAVSRRRTGLDALDALAVAAGLFLALGHFHAFLAGLFPAQSLLSVGVSDLIEARRRPSPRWPAWPPVC